MDVIENQNSSCSRRGAEVAHSIYGVAITINASGYGYFLALEKLFDLHHADVNGSFSHFCIMSSCVASPPTGRQNLHGTSAGNPPRSGHGHLLAR